MTSSFTRKTSANQKIKIHCYFNHRLIVKVHISLFQIIFSLVFEYLMLNEGFYGTNIRNKKLKYINTEIKTAGEKNFLTRPTKKNNRWMKEDIIEDIMDER